MNVVEFKNLHELNMYLATTCKRVIKIIPIERQFVNPRSELLTSAITYILVETEV